MTTPRMDMTLAELQEMAARQQQQIEAQQQLLASKVCESARWKGGTWLVQKLVETQDTKAALMEIKVKARGGGSNFWGNNKVDIMRMREDALLGGIWTKAWKRMECACRLWQTGDMWRAESASCLFFLVWTHLVFEFYFLSIMLLAC